MDRFKYTSSRIILYVEYRIYSITIEPILSVSPSVHRTRFICQHIFHYGFYLLTLQKPKPPPLHLCWMKASISSALRLARLCG